MKKVTVKFIFTPQEASEAYAATLDCAKGKVWMKLSTPITAGCMALIASLVSFWVGIAPVVTLGIKNADIFNCVLYTFCGGYIAWIAWHLFAKAVDLVKCRRLGITDEHFLHYWYSPDGLGGWEIQITFGQIWVNYMPNAEGLHQKLFYLGQSGAFEYSSGVVLVPAFYNERFYFIPRRVLDEHNGEVEKFLEKKFKKRYRIMGR